MPTAACCNRDSGELPVLRLLIVIGTADLQTPTMLDIRNQAAAPVKTTGSHKVGTNFVGPVNICELACRWLCTMLL